MEMLSEHRCEGWLEGYLLTGRHGLFNCCEAFIHIVDSMFNQHAKWLQIPGGVKSPRSITCWPHMCGGGNSSNGTARRGLPLHQSHEIKKRSRAGVPSSRRQLPVVGDGSLPAQAALRQRGNRRQTSGAAMAGHGRGRKHCTEGIGTWRWASKAWHPMWSWPVARRVHLGNAGGGDLSPRAFAALKIRVVNVVDTMKLQPSEHPHGLSDVDLDEIFTRDKRVIFAFHAYPWLIHRLTYRRTNHGNFHVRGRTHHHALRHDGAQRNGSASTW